MSNSAGQKKSLPRISPLSEMLEKAIRGRKVKTALFFTFEFDPGFFESEVLPLLFTEGFAHEARIRVAQLQPMLNQINHLAVYYDKRALREGVSAQLDYEKHALVRKSGVFHAKNAFLIVENDWERDREEGDSLIILTTSANITEGGWWTNVEAAHITEIPQGGKTSIRNDLLGQKGLLSLAVSAESVDKPHHALETVREFVKGLEPYTNSWWDGLRRPRFFVGQSDLCSFLSEMMIEPGRYQLDIISPFFDNTESAGPLNDIIETFKPTKTRIFLPRGRDGSALCKKEFYQAVKNMRGVVWGYLPNDVIRTAPREKNSDERYVHSKVYRFFSPSSGEEFLLIGSVNLTNAAHSESNKGNIESAIFIDRSGSTKRPESWLGSEVSSQPKRFQIELPPEEEAKGLRCFHITIRFDWNTKQLQYYCQAGTDAPSAFDLLSGGVAVAAVDPVSFDSWTKFPQSISDEFRERLLSTAFAKVRVGNEVELILIEEENMEMKPDLLRTLTASEILHYWALLKGDQKNDFIAARLRALLKEKLAEGFEGSDLTPFEYEHRSMFDKFAGIFHAFGCLADHLSRALGEDSRPKEAHHYLFGEKFDSLSSLIEKLGGAEQEDLVNCYVSVLCAQEVVDGIQKEFPDFFSENRDRFRALRLRLEIASEMRQRLKSQVTGDSEAFIEWFEKVFKQAVQLPKDNEAA